MEPPARSRETQALVELCCPQTGHVTSPGLTCYNMRVWTIQGQHSVESSNPERPDLSASHIFHFVTSPSKCFHWLLKQPIKKHHSRSFQIFYAAKSDPQLCSPSPARLPAPSRCPGPPASHLSVGAPRSLTQLGKQICQNNHNSSDKWQS